jgi:hypothetical protein
METRTDQGLHRRQQDFAKPSRVVSDSATCGHHFDRPLGWRRDRSVLARLDKDEKNLISVVRVRQFSSGVRY